MERSKVGELAVAKCHSFPCHTTSLQIGGSVMCRGTHGINWSDSIQRKSYVLVPAVILRACEDDHSYFIQALTNSPSLSIEFVSQPYRRYRRESSKNIGIPLPSTLLNNLQKCEDEKGKKQWSHESSIPGSAATLKERPFKLEDGRRVLSSDYHAPTYRMMAGFWFVQYRSSSQGSHCTV